MVSSCDPGTFSIKARKLLTEAEAILAIELYDFGGRTAYLAGFSCRTGAHLRANRKVGQDARRRTR